VLSQSCSVRFLSLPTYEGPAEGISLQQCGGGSSDFINFIARWSHIVMASGSVLNNYAKVCSC
jgi:hypothetical protein